MRRVCVCVCVFLIPTTMVEQLLVCYDTRTILSLNSFWFVRVNVYCIYASKQAFCVNAANDVIMMLLQYAAMTTRTNLVAHVSG